MAVRTTVLDVLSALLIPFSPPLAILLLAWIAAARGSRLLDGLRRDPLTAAALVSIAIVGIGQVLRLGFHARVLGDALGVLALLWLFLFGEHVLASPSLFFRLLSRSLGVFSLAALVAYLLPVSAKLPLLGQNVVLIEHVPGNPKATFLLGLPANSFGPLVVAAFLLGLTRAFHRSSIFERVEGMAIATIGLIAATALQVRLAIVGAAAGMLILSFAVGLRGLIAAALAMLLVFTGSPGLLDRFEGLLAVQQTEAPRLYLWQSALTILKRQPWWGVGPGQFGVAYQKLPPVPEWAYFDDPHNAYLRLFAEWGIPAAFLFFGWLFWKLDRVWTRNHHVLRWGAVSAVAAFLFMAFFETYFLKFHVAMPFWLLLGLAQREDWE